MNQLQTAALILAGLLVARAASKGAFHPDMAAFPVNPERITLHFGADYGADYSERRLHRGLDVAPYPASFGASVFAPVHGVVIRSGDSGGGYGRRVTIEETLNFNLQARDINGIAQTVPAGSKVYWLLAHLRSEDVKQGDRVRAGQKVGEVGSTGHSYGAHVHVELRGFTYLGNYLLLNPLDYLTKRVGGLSSQLVWANQAVTNA